MRRKLAQEQETTRQNVEQVEELEEYVNVQIEYFAEKMVGKDKLLNKINEKYNKQQEEWEAARATLERQCSEVEVVSEKRRLDLLLAQNKLLQTEGENNAQIDDLRRTLAVAQFHASITEERI